MTGQGTVNKEIKLLFGPSRHTTGTCYCGWLNRIVFCHFVNTSVLLVQDTPNDVISMHSYTS